MSQTRYLNLVFQGGGVRGMAYAGVLDKMPDECVPHSVGGTSAGAIVAALLAIGTPPKEVRNYLSDPKLYRLIDPKEAERYARVWSAFEDLLPILKRRGEKVQISKYGLWRWSRRHKKALDDAAAIWQDRGFYRADRLREWLDGVFGAKTFNDIKLHDLRVLASDVSSQEYVVYSKVTHGGESIAAAVHASASIPLFFVPVLNVNRHLVDGGILSNFPSFLFAQGGYPTVGFQLADFDPPGQIRDTMAYLKSLVFTMTGAHDKQRPLPKHFVSYTVKTPAHLPSTKFDLKPEDGDALFKAGQEVGENAVQWLDWSAPAPYIPYYDPSPDDALELCLSEARELRDLFYQREQYVDSLKQTAVFEARIEADWSSAYEFVGSLQVAGGKQLFLSRITAVGTGNMTRLIPSLVEVNMVCDEITAGRERCMIRIPAENGETKKGFVLFYVPPVSESDGERTFRTILRIPKEFEKTLGFGREDSVSYSFVQQANDHQVDFTFRLRVSIDLPQLTLSTDFGLPMLLGPRFQDEETDAWYNTFESHIPLGPVHARREFLVNLRMK